MARFAPMLVLMALLWPLDALAQNSASDPVPGAPGSSEPGTPRPEIGGVGAGCIRAGDPIQIVGRGFGDRPRGKIELRASGRDWPLEVRAWSNRRIRLTPPRGLELDPGRSYRLRWVDGRRTVADLGRIEVCASAGGTARPPVAADVRLAPDGRPEYVASVPAAATAQASATLQGLGASILRTRALPALGEAVLIVTLPDGVSLGDARAALGAAVPGALDLHHLYGFVASPRIYARDMVTGGGADCTLGQPVAVGIIDGPVDPRHPAFAGARPQQARFLPEDARAAPADHGTAVAALIVGAAEAGALAGYAPGARLYAAEAFWAGRSGPASAVEWIAAALDWQLGQQVRLVNLSFAGRENQALARLVGAAAGRGAILVAAAGNEAASEVAFPAAAPEVIAVTAIDAARRLYRQANQGAELEFAAPGVDVWSAKAPEGGQYASGTSFAAPFVTAAAAHLLAERGNLSADVIRRVLADAVVDLGPEGRDRQFGWGLVRIPGC